jgi:hypothetical protein
MDKVSFFDNFIPLFSSLFENEKSIYLLHYSSILLVNLAAYLYVVVRFYKVLCYSKMTFEWLPMINPYVWPFSMFQVLTNPYFNFWAKLLPMLKFEKSSLEISGIVGLEALNSCTFFFVKLTGVLLPILEKTEKYIQNIPN